MSRLSVTSLALVLFFWVLFNSIIFMLRKCINYSIKHSNPRFKLNYILETHHQDVSFIYKEHVDQTQTLYWPIVWKTNIQNLNQLWLTPLRFTIIWSLQSFNNTMLIPVTLNLLKLQIILNQLMRPHNRSPKLGDLASKSLIPYGWMPFNVFEPRSGNVKVQHV